MTAEESNPATEAAAEGGRTNRRRDVLLFWTVRCVSALGVALTLWAAISTGDMLVHGHLAYAVLLGLAFLACLVAAVRSWRRPAPTRGGFVFLRGMAVLASCAVLALIWWLVPYSATTAALVAMTSDDKVTVTETPTRIVMTAAGTPSTVGVFFQPGALVDARAYAAILRPLAENGHTVVIPKQPLGIAFLSTGSFTAAQNQYPPVQRWVLGGHSLGGVVAALDAQSFAEEKDDAVAGVLFFASYPAADMSTVPLPVLSVSSANDQLATAEKLEAARATLPGHAVFTTIEGGVHADFGDYGPQRGDGEPTISHDDARAQISQASLAFVASLGQ
ncbi:alpha/beta hydrolase [Specibacter sp. NPDC057265]|uniref:alpha/beta hydrolase n=1 Tax=Specibacter sp. NPDC057265 TaxID=3346075 RepID=UPI00363A61AA